MEEKERLSVHREKALKREKALQRESRWYEKNESRIPLGGPSAVK